MQIPFIKMEGLGNDFILINSTEPSLPQKPDWPDLSKKWCHRQFGIGADGIIIYSPSDAHDAVFRIYNNDGSEAEMCGNGMRCFGKYLYENIGLKKLQFTVETRAGLIRPAITLGDSGTVDSVCVDMGPPALTPRQIPCTASGETVVRAPITVAWGSPEITAVSMGNPHAIIFVEDPDGLDIEALGRPIETSPFFPEKTNVEFVAVTDRSHIKMRVWERGAGETLACGTGACASVVAAILNGYCDDTVSVSLPGGKLSVTWDRQKNTIYKSGPARKVFDGHIELVPHA